MRLRFERDVLLLLFPARPRVSVVMATTMGVSAVDEEGGRGGWGFVGVSSGLLLLLLPVETL